MISEFWVYSDVIKSDVATNVLSACRIWIWLVIWKKLEEWRKICMTHGIISCMNFTTYVLKNVLVNP